MGWPNLVSAGLSSDFSASGAGGVGALACIQSSTHKRCMAIPKKRSPIKSKQVINITVSMVGVALYLCLSADFNVACVTFGLDVDFWETVFYFGLW